MQKPIDYLIQILSKQKKKIIDSATLKSFIYEAFGKSTPTNKIYKITFQLKNRGYLTSLRKDLFYISNPEKPIKIEEIEDERYWKILKDHCNGINKQRYIGGLTALEIHLHGQGVTIPESILIINSNKQSIETIINEKQINFKKYESKGKNLMKSLIKQTNEINMQNTKNILIANLELSILECLYNFDTSNKGYIEECIKKAIKKNGKTLDMSKIETIIKLGKHNSSLNRLYNFTKLAYPNLSDSIKQIIKKYGFIL